MNQKRLIESIRQVSTGFFFGATLVHLYEEGVVKYILITLSAVAMLLSVFVSAYLKQHSAK